MQLVIKHSLLLSRQSDGLYGGGIQCVLHPPSRRGRSDATRNEDDTENDENDLLGRGARGGCWSARSWSFHGGRLDVLDPRVFNSPELVANNFRRNLESLEREYIVTRH